MANQVVRFSSTEFRVYRDGKYTGEHYKTRAEAVAAAESSTPAGGQRPVHAPAAPSRPAPAVQPAFSASQRPSSVTPVPVSAPRPAPQPPSSTDDIWFIMKVPVEVAVAKEWRTPDGSDNRGGEFSEAGWFRAQREEKQNRQKDETRDYEDKLVAREMGLFSERMLPGRSYVFQSPWTGRYHEAHDPEGVTWEWRDKTVVIPDPWGDANWSRTLTVIIVALVEGPMSKKEAIDKVSRYHEEEIQDKADDELSDDNPNDFVMDRYDIEKEYRRGATIYAHHAIPFSVIMSELSTGAGDDLYARRVIGARNQVPDTPYAPTHRAGTTRIAKMIKPYHDESAKVDVIVPISDKTVGLRRVGLKNLELLSKVPQFREWYSRNAKNNPNTMIPLPYPVSDYEWGHAQPLASWTSDPLYSYQQYARSNGRARSNGKLAPSPTIGIAKPYRMPDNAGPYLPRIFPYGPYGRPATYEVGKDNPAGEITDPREIEANVQAFTAAFVKMKPRLISILDRNVEFSDQDKEDVVSRTYQYLLRAVREGHSRPGPALMVLALKQRAIDTLRERKHAASPRHQIWDKAHLSGEDISTAELASLGYGQGPTSAEDVVFLRQVTARLPAETREAQKYHISDGDLIALNAQGMNMSDIADMLLEKDSEYVRLKAAAARDDKAAAKVEELLRRVGDTLIKRASRARQKLGEWAGPHRNPRALPNYRGYQPGEREHLPASAFLKPETRSWPVSDKDHAFIALQYMTRGFGNRKEYPMLIQRLAQIWPPSGHPDIWSWYEAHRAQIEQMAGRHMPKIGRENGMTIRRGKPGQKKPYFYMTSRELKEAIASGDAGAQGEADRRGWVGGEPTYTIGGRK